MIQATAKIISPNGYSSNLVGLKLTLKLESFTAGVGFQLYAIEFPHSFHCSHKRLDCIEIDTFFKVDQDGRTILSKKRVFLRKRRFCKACEWPNQLQRILQIDMKRRENIAFALAGILAALMLAAMLLSYSLKFLH